MKKLLNIGFIILFFASCSKDNSLSKGEDILIANNISVNVTAKGFLNFKTSNDIVQFGKLLLDEQKRIL